MFSGDVPILDHFLTFLIIATCIYIILCFFNFFGAFLCCCFVYLPEQYCCPEQSYPQPDLRSQTNAISGTAATNIYNTVDQDLCTATAISVLPNAIFDESIDETNSTGEECVVCLGPQHPRGRLVPCGHASFCYQCSLRISVGQDPRCPLCRTTIQHVNRE